MVRILPILMVGMVFSGFSRAATSYFYATEQNIKAYAMIYGEPLFLFLFLISIPILTGIMGTWISITLSQVAIAVVGVLLLKIAKFN